ncbi:MAG: hypothetical protein K2I71_00970, partial [Helicobacter sp.]|nr:hypothetical protein [Helicobacter sp.]
MRQRSKSLSFCFFFFLQKEKEGPFDHFYFTEDTPMTEIISVRFRPGGKQYYFDPAGLTVA